MNGPFAVRSITDVYATPDGSPAAGPADRSAAASPTSAAPPTAADPAASAAASPTSAAPPTAADPTADAEREAWEQAQRVVAAHRICPGCGTAMVDRSCKLRCLRCGFFLDCSDG